MDFLSLNLYGEEPESEGTKQRSIQKINGSSASNTGQSIFREILLDLLQRNANSIFFNIDMTLDELERKIGCKMNLQLLIIPQPYKSNRIGSGLS
jgi:hypothetical protein